MFGLASFIAPPDAEGAERARTSLVGYGQAGSPPIFGEIDEFWREQDIWARVSVSAHRRPRDTRSHWDHQANTGLPVLLTFEGGGGGLLQFHCHLVLIGALCGET